MLGIKSKPKAQVQFSNGTNGTNGTTTSGETCVVSSGTFIEGKFRATENVRLDGTIKGEIICDSRLVVGEKGKVEGNVDTQDGIIMGTIEGQVEVHGTLTLKGTAFIRGTIQAKYLVVEEGARYIGECKIGG